MVHGEGAVLSRIVTAVALITFVIIAAGGPTAYFLLMRANDVGRLEADANVRSFLMSQAVSSEPELWPYKAHLVQGILSRRFSSDEEDFRSVVDTNGAALYSIGTPLADGWTVTVARPVYDSGRIVAQVEIRHSTRHLLASTGLVATLSWFLGLCGFFAVRTLPMRALEQAWTKATHDPLTGLPNRLLLADRIAQAAALSARSNTTFAIHCLDLDHFKEINDSRGHGAGDVLLAQAADRMRSCLRQGDTLARVGGDEFILLENDVSSPDDAAATAERLIEAIRRPFDLNGTPAMVSTSVGIALYEKDGQSASELLQNADSALYRAKALRRGTLHFFDKALNERLDARKRLERELRAALAADQFELLYQPQVSLPDGKIAGVEALVRWNHPTRGILGAHEFISLAEETGLIVPVGEWVLRTACAQAIGWRDITLAVNISPAQFRKGNIVDTVRATLEETGFPGRRLELEITEGLLITDTDATLGMVNELRRLGVRFAMDDFGTGYSSLGYLHKFRFDKIKLDKSFVHDLGKRPDADAIAHTVVDLARTLRIRANAEGVETQLQLDRLIAEGYEEAQGYLFTQPLNAHLVDQFIRAFTPGARVREVARPTGSAALAQG